MSLMMWAVFGLLLYPFLAKATVGHQSAAVNAVMILICGPAVWLIFLALVIVAAARKTTLQNARQLGDQGRILADVELFLRDLKKDANLPHAHTVLTETQEQEIESILDRITHGRTKA